jgi:O-antigen/teichoic acid export membrane protein
MAESKLSERARAAFRRVAGSGSFRGVVLIGGGAAVGQAIMVAATPIVSRLYGPHAYGALAVFGSILTIASILVTFRFEVTIPLPKEDEEARDILVLALTLALCAAGLACLGLFGWQFFSKAINPDPLFRHLAWTLPLGMFGIGCYQSLAYWATRKRLYRPISVTRMNQSIASLGTQILLYRLPPPGLGLMLAYIVGQAFGVRPLFLAFRDSSPKVALPSVARLASLARKYFKLSAYGSATAVAMSVGSSLPSLLLAKAYGLEAAGIYLMASRVFALPAQMVGAAVSQVFMGETSQRLREDPRSVPNYFHSVHRNLRWIGGGVLVLGAISPWILPWILGAKWPAVGTVAAILAPMAAMEISVSPLYNITVIGNRPKLQLLTGILPMGLSIVGLGVPIFLGFSYKSALIGYTLSRCLGFGLIYITYRNVARSIGAGLTEPCLPGETIGPIDIP